LGKGASFTALVYKEKHRLRRFSQREISPRKRRQEVVSERGPGRDPQNGSTSNRAEESKKLDAL